MWKRGVSEEEGKDAGGELRKRGEREGMRGKGRVGRGGERVGDRGDERHGWLACVLGVWVGVRICLNVGWVGVMVDVEFRMEEGR